MPVVKFVKENKEIEVPQGAWLRAEAVKAGVNLNQGVNGVGQTVNKLMNCKGFGFCGTCRVLVTKGMENTNPMTFREKLKFGQVNPLLKPLSALPDPIPCMAYQGFEDTMRLACMTQVNGDIEVESAPELDLFGENFFS